MIKNYNNTKLKKLLKKKPEHNWDYRTLWQFIGAHFACVERLTFHDFSVDIPPKE